MFGRSFGGFALSVVVVSLAAGCGDDTGGGTAGGSTAASTADGSGGSTSPSGSGGGSGDGGNGSGASGGSGGDGSGASGIGGAPPLDCDEGPALGQGPTCIACQAESCCLNASGCNANESCQAVDACTLENNSVAECIEGEDEAVPYVSGVVVCRQNNCAEECGFEQAICGNILPSPASCTEDVQAACCDEMTACGENDACVALIYQCLYVETCETEACVAACLALYPDGEDDFQAMDDCWNTVECLDE